MAARTDWTVESTVTDRATLRSYLGAMASREESFYDRRVLLEGTIQKTSGFVLKSWETRYLVVATDGVSYYVDAEDVRRERPPKALVELDGLQWSSFQTGDDRADGATVTLFSC